MHLTKPQVFFVGQTELNTDGLEDYLTEIDADKYAIDEFVSGAEELIRAGGKLCYRSWQPELNPNVTRTRDDAKQYMRDAILKAAHGSVLEHSSVSFIFHNVSRVFTHELVRHRAGTAMSQESLRYVRLTDLNFWVPQILKDCDANDGAGVALVLETVRYLETVQKKLADIYKIDGIKDFGLKKKLTSAFRRVAPIGLGTGILWTMNIRTARHILQLRTHPSAEEEMRLVFDQVGAILQKKFPLVFQDFTRTVVDGHGYWKAENPANPYEIPAQQWGGK